MPFRIATFNLKDFFLPRNDAERSVAVAKFQSVAASLRRANADVVALQEVGEEQQLERLVEAVADLGYEPPVVGSVDKRGIRCAILSRSPIQWSQVHSNKTLAFPRFVAGDPDPFAERIPLRRGIVHVRVEHDDIGEIDVLTAHFKSHLPAGTLSDSRPKSRILLINYTFCKARPSKSARLIIPIARNFVLAVWITLLPQPNARVENRECLARAYRTYLLDR